MSDQSKQPKLFGAAKSAVLGWSNKLGAPEVVSPPRSRSENLLGAVISAEPLSSNPYKYQPIPTKRQIRLIELYSDDTSDPLHCRIFLASLNKLPEYEAISYAWGDPAYTVLIECNNNRKQLSISYNLGVALEHLRWKDKSRVLWVDAICINQQNVAERGDQVQLMREVYRHAERVVAWVGEEDEADAAAMNLGGLMTQLFNRKEATRDYSIAKAGKVSAFAIQDAWKALANFIKRPWFGRVWIVQEMAIPTHLILQCGQNSMDWDEFSRALKLLHMQSRSALTVMKIDSSLERLEVLAAFRAGVQADSRKIGGDLYSNVIGTRLFSSTDPRDHIFALLGVTDRLDDNPIVPDYSSGFEELYCQFVKNAIRHNGNLDILGQADSPFNDELPSWVPDWRRFWRVRPLSSKQNTHYRACGESQPHVRDGPNRRILTVSAKIVDKIQILGPGFESSKKISLGPLDGIATDAIERVLKKFQSYLQIWLSDGGSEKNTIAKPKIPTVRSRSPNALMSGPTRTLISGSASEAPDYPRASTSQDSPSLLDTENIMFSSPPLSPSEAQKGRSTLSPVLRPSFSSTDFKEQRSKQITQIPSQLRSRDSKSQWAKVGIRSRSPSTMADAKTRSPPLIPRLTSPSAKTSGDWKSQMRTPSTPPTPTSRIKADHDASNVTTMTKPAKIPSRRITTEHDLEVFRPEIVAITHVAEVLNSPDTYSENANQYLTGESIDEAYWRTLIGDQIRGDFDKVKKPPKEWGIAYKIWHNRLSYAESIVPSWFYKDPDPDLKIPDDLNRRFDDAVRPESQLMHYVQFLNLSSFTSKILKSGLALTPHMMAPKIRKDVLAKEFTLDILHTAQNRQFCASEKNYMGWAPPDAQVGDLICVLLGGRVPFLLRPHGNMFRLIGELYIHGLMEGQAMKMKDVKTQEIRLV
ncbi:hypothetical protein MMC14_006049 [Varicellaria rhodocarpa]|nr:hypothetical protein [Varicellaria rhodocarpa]